MAVRTPIEQTEGLYFITFTCCHRLPLFEIVEGYDTVYKWFDYLKSKNHFVKGYVIMSNHLHVLVDFSASSKSINTIVSNAILAQICSKEKWRWRICAYRRFAIL